MNPVSHTAYLTCGARADDAAKEQPICGDRYAARFLAGEGEGIYRQFKSEPNVIISIVARHRMIDDILRERIAGNPDTAVVILGAGFDSRAFRIEGGRWIEIDEAQVIERKNALLPAGEARNPLRRIAIDFAHEALADKLPPFSADTPVVVVMEGIFIYLDDEQRNATLAALQHAYPRHTLVCDMNTRAFMERHGKSLTQRIEALGTQWKFLPDDPAAHFQAAGYRLEAKISIIKTMLERSGSWFTTITAWLLPKVMRDGLALYVFRRTPATHGSGIAGGVTVIFPSPKPSMQFACASGDLFVMICAKRIDTRAKGIVMFQRYAAGLAIAAALAGLPTAAFAGVFKCVGPDGASTFSDKPCPKDGDQKQATISSDSALSHALTRDHDRELGGSCSDMADRARRCNMNIDRTITSHFQDSCYGPQHRFEMEHNRELAKQRRGQPIDWDHDPAFHVRSGAELKCGFLVTDMWQFLKDNFRKDLTEQEIKAIDYQVQAWEKEQPADQRTSVQTTQ